MRFPISTLRIILTTLILQTFAVLAFANQPTTPFGHKLVASARSQIGMTLLYDPAYKSLKYPGGDIAVERGVCTDVIIRALRDHGIDLQKNIHQHMKTHHHHYPKNWGTKKLDPNIDHRRVPNISTYLKMHGCQITANTPYLPGDLIVWNLGRGILHIGILSDRKTENQQRYLVIHNICCGVKEEDILDSYPVVAHFRINADFIGKVSIRS